MHTVLTLAAQFGDKEMLEFILLELEVNPERRAFDGRTALLTASCTKSNLQNMEFLVQHGANLDTESCETARGLTRF